MSADRKRAKITKIEPTRNKILIQYTRIVGLTARMKYLSVLQNAFILNYQRLMIPQQQYHHPHMEMEMETESFLIRNNYFNELINWWKTTKT